MALTTRLRIQKAKRGLIVRLPATNGKLFYSSETFTQKPAAWKNIFGVAKFFSNSKPFLVQDDTLQIPVVYKVKGGKAYPTDIKPKK